MSDSHSRPRAAVTVVFGVNGLVFGIWAARLPAIGDRLHLSVGEIGVALAALAAGALVAMPLAGRAASRFGSRVVMRSALVAFCVAAALTPVAPSLAALCLASVLFGASNGTLDVSMNAHGVAVEARDGRPILSSFHAAFSLGGLVGALLGAAGDALTMRLGSVALVRRGALLAAAGIGAALLVGAPAAALIGFACLGAGLSIVVPQVFRAAASTGDTGPALARVSTVGYTGFLAGPPLIGALSEATSLPLALALLPLLGLVVAALAPLTRVPPASG